MKQYTYKYISDKIKINKVQLDLQSVYSWAISVNMVFNSKKFEWVRYTVNPDSAHSFQYLSPDQSSIEVKDNLRDLGVLISSDLSFSLQISKVVSTASQLVGWGLRTFRRLCLNP